MHTDPGPANHAPKSMHALLPAHPAQPDPTWHVHGASSRASVNDVESGDVTAHCHCPATSRYGVGGDDVSNHLPRFALPTAQMPPSGCYDGDADETIPSAPGWTPQSPRRPTIPTPFGSRRTCFRSHVGVLGVLCVLCVPCVRHGAAPAPPHCYAASDGAASEDGSSKLRPHVIVANGACASGVALPPPPYGANGFCDGASCAPCWRTSVARYHSGPRPHPPHRAGG